MERLPFPFRAALLQDHGPVVSGSSVAAAVDSAVELEETAALLLTLGQLPDRLLTSDEARELAAAYGTPWDG